MKSTPTRPRSAFRIQHTAFASRSGFSLVELLVVIGIIVVLIGILVPLVGKVRNAARAADTQSALTSIGAQIQAYYNDFKAYPGPLSNFQVNAGMNGTPPAIAAGTVTGSADLDSTNNITGTENLVLGLLGGLRNVGGVIQYETAWVGTGAGALGAVPKKIPAYGDTSNLSLRTFNNELTGDYEDSNAKTGTDTTIPEYVDRFTDPMPLLFLRACAGSRSLANALDDNPVVTDGTNAARPGQYDFSQIAPYVDGVPAASIGPGKSLAESEYVNATFGEHGLRPGPLTATTDPASAGYSYPYNIYTALRHPTAANTPKQKDGYILISAGIDRVYGTRDDITNFGAY